MSGIYASGEIPSGATGEEVILLLATGAQTLPAIQQSASGDQEFIGSGAQALPAVEQAGAGAQEFTGSAASVLPSITQAGSGAQEFIGSAAQTLPSITQAGAAETYHTVSVPGSTHAHTSEAPVLEGAAYTILNNSVDARRRFLVELHPYKP